MAEATVSGNQGVARAGKPAAEEAPRSYVTRSLSELVPGVTRLAYKRRSPAGALLISNWEQVVGPRLARDTAPQKLSRGVLTIGCNGPVAMELQHLSEVVIERINMHAGEKLVTSLRFVQGFVPVAPVVVPRHVPVAAIPIPDLPAGDLNDALARLRAALSTRK